MNAGICRHGEQVHCCERSCYDRRAAWCSHLLQHNALGMGSACKRLLPLIAQVTLLVVLVCPQLLPAVIPELSSGSQPPSLPAGSQIIEVACLRAWLPAARQGQALTPWWLLSWQLRERTFKCRACAKPPA